MCTYQGCIDEILLKKFLVKKYYVTKKFFCVVQNYLDFICPTIRSNLHQGET